MHYTFTAFTLYSKKINIPSFQDLYCKIIVKNHKEMLGIDLRIPKFKKGSGYLQPVLPLISIKLASVDEAKGTFLVFELNTRTGQAATSTKYKKYICKFEEGTPQE